MYGANMKITISLIAKTYILNKIPSDTSKPLISIRTVAQIKHASVFYI
jgi:hypothetical protein